MDYQRILGISVILSLVELAVCAKNGNGNLILGSPRNIKIEIEENKLKVSWDPPLVSTSRCPIRGYRVRYKESDKKRHQTGNTPRNTRHFLLPNVQRGKEYIAKVLAYNCKGNGAPTDWIKGRLPAGAAPGPAGSIRTRTFTDKISVHWEPPRDASIPVLGYKVGYGQEVKDQITFTAPGDAVNYTIDSLKPSTQYLISLRPFNTFGEGRPLFDLIYTREDSGPTTAPFVPPANIRAMILSPNTAWVGWTDTGLGKYQHNRDDRVYRVKYGPDGANAYMYKEVSDLQAYLEDLVPFTLYEFSVSVKKDGISSPYSMVVKNKTFEAAPGSSPRMLTADARTNPSRIDMTWQPPHKPNGIITGYLVLYTKDRSIPDTQWNLLAVEGNQSSATISNLPADTLYFCRVQARNRKGYGPLSAIALVRTPPTAIVVPALLQQPVIRSVRSDSETSVLLSWSDPNQFDYYRPHYFIQFGPADILVGQEDENGKKWSYIDTADTSISVNITHGVIYSFQVKAFSLDRYSEFSEAVLFIPNISESRNTTTSTGNAGPKGLPPTKDVFNQQVLVHHSISAIIVWTELDKSCKKDSQFRREKYKIRYFPLNNPNDVKEIFADSKMTSIDNLKPNIVYEYQIQRVHPKYAETPWSSPKQIDTHVNT